MQQKIALQRLSLESTNPYGYNTLDVHLSYDKGGMSVLSGKEVQRGYTLYVIPHKVDGGVRMTKAYDGGKQFVQATKRFGQKEMETIALEIMREGSDLNVKMRSLRETVIEKNGFKVLSEG
jgi:hypothetical protein